jgi:ketosteroid isomerase-like protein
MRSTTVATSRLSRPYATKSASSTPLVEVRNGKVFRLRSFPDRAEALEAAGLQEGQL